MNFYLPALLMCAVSGAYYVLDIGETRLRVRLMVSAHGVLGALLYIGAILWWDFSPRYRPWAVLPYLLAYALPLSSVIYAFLRFRGPKLLHFIQILNLFAFMYAIFIGGMAVSGDWL